MALRLTNIGVFLVRGVIVAIKNVGESAAAVTISTCG